MIEKMFIKNRKDLKMAVRLNLNESNDKIVFLEHGLGARKEYPHMLVLEEVFSKHGYNVINFDATNSLNESEISNEGITTSGHYEDLEDVINWACKQKFYKEPFALAGQSLGAITIVKYAGNFPEKVNLLIPCAFPYYNYNENELNPFALEILKNGFYDKVSKSTGRVLHMTSSYLEDLKTIDLTKQIKQIKAKSHIIIGSNDSDKHMKNSKSLYDMLNCEKEFHLLDGVPHDLANIPHDKELFEKTLNQILDKEN